eukprot:Colp12_sorted_trinity150504_noHs@13358
MAEEIEVAASVKAQPSPAKSFIAGGVGGVCLILVGHPLDTVKTKMQAGQFTSTMEAVKATVAKSGYRGLYAGMAAPIVGVTPMYALCFFGYTMGQRLFCDADAFKELKLGQIALAGATSGLFTTPILAPGERVKCLLQVHQGKFSGPNEVFKYLYKTQGLKGCTRGFGATMARDSLASAFYFSSYEYLKHHLTPEGASGPNAAGTLFAGGVAGVLNWAAALPIDVVKSRLQSDLDGKYKGFSHVFKEIVKTEGLKGFYRGFTPVMLRAFPANAACFFGYESAIKFLDWVGMP